MSRTTWSIAAASLVGLAVGIGIDRSTGPVVAAPGVASAKVADSDARRVALDPELAKRARVETAQVAKVELKPTLRLVGSVNFDPDQVAEVGARIEGRVARMLVSTGDEVKAGEPLAEVESDELGGAIAALLSTRANLIAAEHHDKRESALATQQLSSAPVVERARAEVKALRASLKGAEQRLMAMGFTQDELRRLEAGRGSSRVTLRAPLDGEVVARYAVLGEVVSPTEPLFRIAELDHLWVELDVFERDLARVAEGNVAEIESETHPGRTFHGRVTHVDATVDLATRTARVRVEVENSERLLRPGQFVHARLATEGNAQHVLGVPRSAVLQVEGEPSVFLALGKDQYIARAVELGASAGDTVEITRGLAEGDTIVTAGAFVLKSELLR